jgi:hypothetical protein
VRRTLPEPPALVDSSPTSAESSPRSPMLTADAGHTPRPESATDDTPSSGHKRREREGGGNFFERQTMRRLSSSELPVVGDVLAEPATGPTQESERALVAERSGDVAAGAGVGDSETGGGDVAPPERTEGGDGGTPACVDEIVEALSNSKLSDPAGVEFVTAAIAAPAPAAFVATVASETQVR